MNAEGVEDEKEDDNEIEDEEEEDDYGDEGAENGEDQADVEEDGEYNDTIKIEGIPIGEELLTSLFVLPNEAAMTQTMTISKRIEDKKE